MIEKITDQFKKIFDMMPKSAPGASMRYILWYALFLIFCAFLYIAMLLADWIATGKPNVQEMRQFISTMLSGSAVAAIGFVCRWVVDKDGNGTPDEAEKENRPYPPYPTPNPPNKGDKK